MDQKRELTEGERERAERERMFGPEAQERQRRRLSDEESERAGKMVREVRGYWLDLVNRMGRLFAGYPDIARDDLKAECVAHLIQNHHKYDPGRSAPQTWAIMTCRRHLLDLAKKCRRRAARDARAREVWNREYVGPTSDGDEDLADWLRDTYRAIHRNLSRYVARTGTEDRCVQMLAVAALARRLGLDSTAVAELLGRREDLRGSLHMEQVPSDQIIRGWLLNAAEATEGTEGTTRLSSSKSEKEKTRALSSVTWVISVAKRGGVPVPKPKLGCATDQAKA